MNFNFLDKRILKKQPPIWFCENNYKNIFILMVTFQVSPQLVNAQSLSAKGWERQRHLTTMAT